MFKGLSGPIRICMVFKDFLNHFAAVKNDVDGLATCLLLPSFWCSAESQLLPTLGSG